MIIDEIHDLLVRADTSVTRYVVITQTTAADQIIPLLQALPFSRIRQQTLVHSIDFIQKSEATGVINSDKKLFKHSWLQIQQTKTSNESKMWDDMTSFIPSSSNVSQIWDRTSHSSSLMNAVLIIFKRLSVLMLPIWRAKVSRYSTGMLLLLVQPFANACSRTESTIWRRVQLVAPMQFFNILHQRKRQTLLSFRVLCTKINLGVVHCWDPLQLLFSQLAEKNHFNYRNDILPHWNP